MDNLTGYVLYNNDEKKAPFGVVSDNHECHALTNYIPASIKRVLIQIEDKRFYEHGAFDYRGIIRAMLRNITAGSIIQGGSSITQQLARNLLRDNSKTLGRKLREGVKAISLELQFSKEEILDLYFNNVFFGKNLWGIRSASLHYFSKEVEVLNHNELLYLVTILRAPNLYRTNKKKAQKRFHALNEILSRNKIISFNRYEKNQQYIKHFKNHSLEIVRNVAIPFITETVIRKSRKIYTTIDATIHDELVKIVKYSKQPLSIVAIRNEKVIGFASTYGSDYPFISKTNVGSTLKPFLYCLLMAEETYPERRFQSLYNQLSLPVREVNYLRDEMTLDEALFHSNNNAFINACSEHGLERCFAFLANVLQKPTSIFFPSSILGATKCGLSLTELAVAYDRFFSPSKCNEATTRCIYILNRVLIDKYGINIDNAFLKTGTTNLNKERFAVLKSPDVTFAILKNDSDSLASKDTGFWNVIKLLVDKIIRKKTDYKWS